ncbi:hypothetical protein [Dyadobacter sp. CY343]|uniref:hypothetical protein n=1 Tax=Dyadobacter sp. CY343 TaxID=2907299 RepID=UPI001F43D9D7|nr:hypothetical protein [Dyadobacter sp. CY343]MCE7061345.1 hypothetical protein [Dyadobacter sp. CY343]
MKKTLLLAFLTICWLGADAFSQQTTKPPEKAVDAKLPFKWDVTLKLYPLIATGHMGIMTRYSPNEKGAFRLAFENIEFGKTKSVQYIVVVDGPRLDTVRVTTSKFGYGYQRIGYEIHFNSGRHQLYCGMDLGFAFAYDRYNPADARGSRRYDLSANPLVGLKYRVLDRLSLSAELAGSLAYHHRSLIAHNRDIINENMMWTISLDNFYMFNISYHF